MNSLFARIEHVSESVVEPLQSLRAEELPAGGSSEARIFGIARNAALDELRKRKRRAGLQVDLEDESSPTPAEYAELTLRRETVRAALATLDPREREIVALKFAGELGNAAIANVLRISESNAGTRLHRALEKLRKACDDNA